MINGAFTKCKTTYLGITRRDETSYLHKALVILSDADNLFSFYFMKKSCLLLMAFMHEIIISNKIQK